MRTGRWTGSPEESDDDATPYGPIKQREDPAAALLSVTVVDPACGSGHFLLAAARRIATRVARHRTGGVAWAEDYRHALREVARASIHGVDRNPLAVELTKVALWIETVEPGKPLGFLDANIRVGDSLLGVFDLDALRHGIPRSAFLRPHLVSPSNSWHQISNHNRLSGLNFFQDGLSHRWWK